MLSAIASRGSQRGSESLDRYVLRSHRPRLFPIAGCSGTLVSEYTQLPPTRVRVGLSTADSCGSGHFLLIAALSVRNDASGSEGNRTGNFWGPVSGESESFDGRHSVSERNGQGYVRTPRRRSRNREVRPNRCRSRKRYVERPRTTNAGSGSPGVLCQPVWRVCS
jgi:hypothetical protein